MIEDFQPGDLKENETCLRVDAVPYNFEAGKETPWGIAARNISIGDILVYIEKESRKNKRGFKQ